MEKEKSAIEIVLSTKEHEFYDFVFDTYATTSSEGKVFVAYIL